MQVLDSLSEACEAMSDDDSAQRYKAEADRLADLFYGSSETAEPSQDPAVPPPHPASPAATFSSPRDAASLRRFVGCQSPSSPPPTADAAVSDAAIRDGVATMMSRLGLSSPRPDDVEDSSSIRQAERHLHETVTNTGDSEVIALSIPPPPTTSNTEQPVQHR